MWLQRLGVLHDGVDVACAFCKSEPETVDHIMLNCPFVCKIWIGILNWWGCQWITPESIVRLLNWWNGWKFKKGELQIWKALPCAVLWLV